MDFMGLTICQLDGLIILIGWTVFIHIPWRILTVLLYMVLHGSHQQKTQSCWHIYQHHGSVMGDITIIYHYIPLYSIIYHYIPLYTIIYHYIPLYTIIYNYIPLYYHYIPVNLPLYIILYIILPYFILPLYSIGKHLYQISFTIILPLYTSRTTIIYIYISYIDKYYIPLYTIGYHSIFAGEKNMDISSNALPNNSACGHEIPCGSPFLSQSMRKIDGIFSRKS